MNGFDAHVLGGYTSYPCSEYTLHPQHERDGRSQRGSLMSQSVALNGSSSETKVLKRRGNVGKGKAHFVFGAKACGDGG